MRFFKILSKNVDLNNTSIRCEKTIDGVRYIEYNSGYIDETWIELSINEILEIDPEWFKTEPEPTEQELINAEILLNQIDILAKQNEQDEVLAQILLNQMEV